MCGAPRGCTTAVARGSSRISAPGAAGVIEVHVGEEQELDRVAFDAELRERGQHQRYGGVRTGIDDGGASAGHHDVRGIHLGSHVFGVDGGDAVGELRQAWQTPTHGVRQHISMNGKLLLTTVMACLTIAAQARSRNAATWCSTTFPRSTRR